MRGWAEPWHVGPGRVAGSRLAAAIPMLTMLLATLQASASSEEPSLPQRHGR